MRPMFTTFQSTGSTVCRHDNVVSLVDKRSVWRCFCSWANKLRVSFADFFFFDTCGHMVYLHTAGIDKGALIGFCGKARRIDDDREVKTEPGARFLFFLRR
jgi:hypothetical protein